MKKPDAVIDTNVLYAGLYSATGASHEVLRRIDAGIIIPLLSVTLLFEYEEILRRNQKILGLSNCEIEDVLDAFCAKAKTQTIHFLWRPQLPDPKDDHILELAVAAGSVEIVTHNIRDFRGSEKFGIKTLTPSAYLGERK